MKDKKSFGAFIKQKRLEKNYSQKDLAELLFVSESAVSKWERGVTYPDITLINDICKVLEITENELFATSNDLENVKIQDEVKEQNKVKKALFWTVNFIYIFALLTCFIVDLTTDGKLSWFFIVFSSLLCAYTFFPSLTWVFKKGKLITFICSTFLSLFLLFLTFSIYTNNYWFLIATFGVFLGYFIVFYPILFSKQKTFLGKDRFEKFSKWFLLTYTLGIALLTLFLLLSIHWYSPYNLGLGVFILAVCSLIPILFGVLTFLKSSKKVIRIVALSIVGVGVILILVSIGCSLFLSFTNYSATYTVDSIYDDVEIDVGDCDVKFFLSQNNQDKVVCTENKKISFDVNVINNVLTIKQKDNRLIFEKLFTFNDLKIELYLSKSTIDMLDIKCSTGDIELLEGFTFSNVDIHNATGDVKLKSNVTNDLNIEVSTGNVMLDDCDSSGKVDICTGTGDLQLKNFNCNQLIIKTGTGDIKLTKTTVTNDLHIESGTGNVIFDKFDAKNIYVSSGTGNITGTIISDKIFYVVSRTGNVDVPKTYSGGRCEITVGTGNIVIRYK